MKSKEQKRMEAIARLERYPILMGQRTPPQILEVWDRRKAEARRMRAAFSLPSAETSGAKS